MKRTLDGLSYREAQARNRNEFHKLNKFQQKGLRAKGYRNVGWNSVFDSWAMLKEILVELEEVINLPPSDLTEKRKQKLRQKFNLAVSQLDFEGMEEASDGISDIIFQKAFAKLGI